MEVILLERIGRLGQMGDIVTVKDGFARNFLLPQGKALRATDDNKARFENERAQLEARNLELKKEAESVSTKLDGQAVVAIRQAGDTGQLYGSVSTRDIAELITAAGFNVSRNQVQLDKPIKTIGIHPMQVSLHPEVIVTVDVNVARSEDEAERQARGEDLTVQEGEAPEPEDETIAVEEVFEDEELAQQAEEELADAKAQESDEADASEAAPDNVSGGGDAPTADDAGDTAEAAEEDGKET